MRNKKIQVSLNKGIATRSILLMLIGLLVVVIIAYLVYRVSSSPTLTLADCRSKLHDACLTCKTAGWGDWPNRYDPDPQKREINKNFYDPIDECAKYSEFSAFKDMEHCSDLKEPCKNVFGIT